MRKLIFLVMIGSLLISCSKNEDSALINRSVLSFTMGARDYSFDSTYTARHYISCSLQQIEIEELNHADEYFDIHITGTSESIEAGDYYMNEIPTNKIAGTSTFWYQGLGINYTAKHFTIKVLSYKDGVLNAVFSGGEITNGKITNLKIQ